MRTNDKHLEKFLFSTFRRAFEPLKNVLDKTVKDSSPKSLLKEDCSPSPWLVGLGKGGSRYREYPDISLYRHCMDVFLCAFSFFYHAWLADKLDGVQSDSEEDAERALRVLCAIAFLHDADKYYDSGKSKSPTEDQVLKLYDELEVGEWSELRRDEAWGVVSIVETGRGQGNRLLAGPWSSRLAENLAMMVRAGDALLSAAVRDGYEKFVEEYNKKLREWRHEFATPDVNLRYFKVRQNPIVLYYLRELLLESFYDSNHFPLVLNLSGEELMFTTPEDFDLRAVFDKLYRLICDGKRPSMKREATNGEVTLFNVYDASELEEALETIDPWRLLSYKRVDGEKVENYVRAWAGGHNLSLVVASETGQLLPSVRPEDKIELSHVHRSALCIAIALRADDSSVKCFDVRLQRLFSQLPGLKDQILLAANLTDEAFYNLSKDTKQMLVAMQASTCVEEAELHDCIAKVYGKFPDRPEEDIGVSRLVDTMRVQCCLDITAADAVQSYTVPPYTAHRDGGTCLLCGTPTDHEISAGSMKLVGVKTSAFNNRIGHAKDLVKSTGVNFICDSCIAIQEILAGHSDKVRSTPALVATSVRAIVKPIGSPIDNVPDFGCVEIVNSYDVVRQKGGEGWRELLPWHVEISPRHPLVLESFDDGYKVKEYVDAAYRWALFSLYSGNSVQVFMSKQREFRASFLFESLPATVLDLLRHLECQDDDRGIRRDRLVRAIRCLYLIKEILGHKMHGYDVVAAIDEFGWWPVAWLWLRSDGEKRGGSDSTGSKGFESLVKLAMKEYEMGEEQKGIRELAVLAANIQRSPYNASASMKAFVLVEGLEQYENGKRFGSSREDTIAAMAGWLEQSLERRDLYAKGDGHALSARCKWFAEALYGFLEDLGEKGVRLDARFFRYLRAAYVFLFVEEHRKRSKDRNESSAERDE